VHARKSSSYYTSLENLNDVLGSTGKERMDILEADEHLEDEDLMEMVNAELMPAIVVDKHKANFWAKILPNIRLHPQVEVASGGRIGWAVRKNCPELKKVINEFVKENKKGTLTGNVVFNRYLKDTKYISNAAHGENIRRFNNVIHLFAKYGDTYDFDYLMLTALAYQESRLNQKLRSKVGAVGVMQILPSTAKDKSVGIPDIHKLEPNIHAGTKYLRYVADRYFPESSGIDTLNRALFSFASYNAGPARIASLRKEAEEKGLNPNIWFNNVELIAAKRIGRETVHYVSNIFKYYIAYKLQHEKFVKPK
jgi:membrane-bound lytic murein transglycosylase MltF